MVKSNFLLVDLNEAKTKKLAETITSDTSRKILNHLAEKEDTEASIAQELNLPISTVHYHLQKLQEAHLVIVEEFHYSAKGREVNHYKLANKYIIIAPQHVSGLKEKLKGILPVAFATTAIALLLKFLQESQITKGFAVESAPVLNGAMDSVSQEALRIGVEEVKKETAAKVSEEALAQTTAFGQQQLSQSPDIAFWFLIGSFTAIVLYLLFLIVQEKLRKK